MRLKVGDVLVKKMGGGRRRVRVAAKWKTQDGGVRVELHSLSPSNLSNPRGNTASVTLPLGEDGLPDGYRLEAQ